MIIVTGAAGFIGSCLIAKLNELNFNYIIAVDDFSNEEKNKNLIGKKIKERVERSDFFQWLDQNNREVEFLFHIGGANALVFGHVWGAYHLSTNMPGMSTISLRPTANRSSPSPLSQLGGHSQRSDSPERHEHASAD